MRVVHFVGFWKGDIDLLIVFHSNFDSIGLQNCFQNKEDFPNRKCRHMDIYARSAMCSSYCWILKRRP